MRKPAFCIFLWHLYSYISFFIDHCAGVSNKHCLLPFFISFFRDYYLCFVVAICDLVHAVEAP